MLRSSGRDPDNDDGVEAQLGAPPRLRDADADGEIPEEGDGADIVKVDCNSA